MSKIPESFIDHDKELEEQFLKNGLGDNDLEKETIYYLTATIEKQSKSKLKEIERDYILLINVKDINTNEIVRDHMWIPITKRAKNKMKNFDNIQNMKITFTAKLEEYFSYDLTPKLRAKHIRNIVIKNKE